MKRSFEELLNELATSEKFQTTNLYMLSRMNQEDLNIFRNIWPTVPTQRRRDIMQELVEIAEFNFEVDYDPIFLLGLGDEDADVRVSAISGLWEQENPELIEPLVHLLRTDPVVMVRAAAASALGQFINLRELQEIEHYPALLAEEALLETIREANEHVEVRRRAVEAIAFSSEADVISIIENAYYDSDEKMQVSAIFAMGRNADKRWQPRVIAELDNPNSEIRFEAARACGELEAVEAVPKLIQLIDEDPDLEVQEIAIGALGRIGGPEARSVLEIYLENEIEALALAADEALYELNLFSGSFDLFEFDDGFDDDMEEFYEVDDLNDNGNGYHS
jgi:hypothetical protein